MGFNIIHILLQRLYCRNNEVTAPLKSLFSENIFKPNSGFNILYVLIQREPTKCLTSPKSFNREFWFHISRCYINITAIATVIE